MPLNCLFFIFLPLLPVVRNALKTSEMKVSLQRAPVALAALISPCFFPVVRVLMPVLPVNRVTARLCSQGCRRSRALTPVESEDGWGFRGGWWLLAHYWLICGLAG